MLPPVLFLCLCMVTAVHLVELRQESSTEEEGTQGGWKPIPIPVPPAPSPECRSIIGCDESIDDCSPGAIGVPRMCQLDTPDRVKCYWPRPPRDDPCRRASGVRDCFCGNPSGPTNPGPSPFPECPFINGCDGSNANNNCMGSIGLSPGCAAPVTDRRKCYWPPPQWGAPCSKVTGVRDCLCDNLSGPTTPGPSPSPECPSLQGCDGSNANNNNCMGLIGLPSSCVAPEVDKRRCYWPVPQWGAPCSKVSGVRDCLCV